MIYTENIKKAFNFTVKTHEIDQKQKRKGKDVAYISHPLIVGLILSQVGAEEEVVIAGILHDTVEDSIDEKKVTSEMLEKEFGKRVASLVMGVTENKEYSWKERKKQAAESIKSLSHDLLLLKSADIISNTSEVVDDYKQRGGEIFEKFNAPEPKKENTLQHYLNVVNNILSHWQENPLREDLIYLAKEMEIAKKQDL